MDVFDSFADQFARLPMFFMTFHGQESIEKVIQVRLYSIISPFYQLSTR